jgi:hypothetical protein
VVRVVVLVNRFADLDDSAPLGQAIAIDIREHGDFAVRELPSATGRRIVSAVVQFLVVPAARGVLRRHLARGEIVRLVRVNIDAHRANRAHRERPAVLDEAHILQRERAVIRADQELLARHAFDANLPGLIDDARLHVMQRHALHHRIRLRAVRDDLHARLPTSI